MMVPAGLPACPQVAALRAELSALRRCLERACLVSWAQVDAQLHRQRFSDACAASGFRSGLRLGQALDYGEPARALLALTGPEGARCLRAASSHLVQVVAGACAGRVPCRSDSPSARLVIYGGAGGRGEVLATAEGLALGGGTWQALPGLPAQRPAASMALLGEALYLSGGWGDRARALQRFDTRTGAWQGLPAMRRARTLAASAALGGRLYVCGGLDEHGSSTASVERYDQGAGPEGAWESLRPMRAARCSFVAAPLAGRLHASGGHVAGPRAEDVLEALGSAERLDPASGEWAAAPPLVTGRGAHAVAVARGALFVCGGNAPGPHQGWQVIASAERLAPGATRWVELPRMLEPRVFPAAVGIAGLLYVCGGAADPHGDVALSSVEFFDSARGGWGRAPPLLAPRFGARAVAVCP